MSTNDNEIIIKQEETNTEIIYLQYQGNIDDNNEHIILEVTEESEFDITSANSIETFENSANIKEDVDSPDLVKLEDIAGQIETATENNNASICVEASYDPEISNAVNSIDDDDVKLFQLVNVKQEECEPAADLLMYACKSIDNNDLNKYPCKTCGLVVGCIFCLKSHYESVHLNVGMVQYQCRHNITLLTVALTCQKCNLICQSKEELVEHRQVHFVTCEVCGMSFDSPLFLSNHCKTSHENFEVVISCDLCDQWFKHLFVLSNHYEFCHEMILCIVCFKRFATRSELEFHHNTHSIVLRNEPILPFACSKCDEVFAKISELSTHLSMVHSKKAQLKMMKVKMDFDERSKIICKRAREKIKEDVEMETSKRIHKEKSKI